MFNLHKLKSNSQIIKKFKILFFLRRFQNKQYAIDDREFVYWTNAAGIIIANLPVNIHSTISG